MDNPIVKASLAWLLGTVIIFYLDFNMIMAVIVIVITVTGLYFMFAPEGKLDRSSFAKCRFRPCLRTGFYLICFLLSLGFNALHQWNVGTNISEQFAAMEHTFRGIIHTAPQVDGDLVQFNMFLPDWHEQIAVRIQLESEAEAAQVKMWRRHDQITFTGLLEQPQSATNFGAFDYRNYLEKRHIYWQIRLRGLEEIKIEPNERMLSVSNLLAHADQVRIWLAHQIEQLYPAEQVGWMQGILIGMKQEFSPEKYDQFARLGITHLLAISGLHVGVMIGTLLWVFRQAGCTREACFYIMLGLVPIYVVITGAAPSVVRAGVMALAALYSWKKGWLKDGKTIFSLTLWFMLLIHPAYLFEIGFQLSFAVTAGLIWGVPVLNRLLPVRSLAIRNTLSVTVMAQLVSFPLSVYYFNQFSLLSWLVNLLLVPVVSMAVLPAGLLALLLSFVSASLASYAAQVVIWANRFVFKCADVLDRLDKLHLSWPSPSLLWVSALFLVMLVFFHSFSYRQTDSSLPDSSIRIPFTDETAQNKKTIRFTAVILFGILLIYGYQPQAWKWPLAGTVQFIDVGQGDATLIRTPTGKNILIDGGGRFNFLSEQEPWRQRRNPFDVGKDVVVPLLKQRGVHKLDYVIITHWDYDHFGGLQAVVDEIPIANILFNGTVRDLAAVSNFVAAAISKNIPLYSVHQGMKWDIDEWTTIEFLYPLPAEEVKKTEDQNDHSVVFMLKLFHTNMLFTGDMEADQEEQVLSYLKENLIENNHPLHVMKTAHHGSNTSSTAVWLDYWKPQMAIISAGRNNVYGHPHPNVLERFRFLGSALHRTDIHGEIQVEVRADSMRLRTKLTPDA